MFLAKSPGTEPEGSAEVPVHHAVLDTNVLVSGILFGGKPREVLRLAIAGAIAAYLSPSMLRELREVLARPKFGLPSEVAFTIVEQLKLSLKMAYPQEVVPVIAADPDDDAVIACAVAAQADFIITGDPHLLDLGTYRQIEILSPAVYLDRLAP